MASFLLYLSLFIFLKILLKAKTIHQLDVFYNMLVITQTGVVDERVSYSDTIVLIWKEFTTCLKNQHLPKYKYFPCSIRMKVCALQHCNFWHRLNCKYGE